MLARSRLRPWRLLAAAAAVLVVTSGCSLASTENAQREQSAATPQERLRYVALGDSYTAAPLFPIKDEVNGCLRSSGNYPAKVAAEADLAMVDVSCSGASTVSMFNQQRFTTKSRPPQLDALTADTDVVTLGIGANDFRFFSEMIFECIELAPTDPQGAPCEERNQTARGQDRLERNLGEIGARVGRVVSGIRERAPRARIIMVGYPVLLPEEYGCPNKLPIARGDYAYTRELNVKLAHTVGDGALAAGAEYIDMVEPSEGHDICSDDPWVAGIRGAKGRASGLHPYPEEQATVAELVMERLAQDPPEGNGTAPQAEGDAASSDSAYSSELSLTSDR